MTLDEKAEEQCKKDFCTRCLSFERCDKNIALCSKATNYCKSLLIEELQKEKAELKAQIENYKLSETESLEIISELKADKEYLDNTNNQQTVVILELQKQIDQLSNDNHVLKTAFITQKEQIEKMKCCGNCKQYYCLNDTKGKCNLQKPNKNECGFNICEKWECAKWTDVESIIAESQIGNCCIADRNENQKVSLNNEPPEIQELIDSSAKFLAELIAKDEE